MNYRRGFDRCGADPALVGLAKRCLAPTQPKRPHDAGRLAEEITGYLDAVEVRARKAEVDAAKAEVRARGERKARRLVAAEPNRLPAYTVESDILENLKRIYYFCKRMARAVIPSEISTVEDER